ncbi:MAG TPA: hypothetical protein VGA02_12245 [Gemmatimonadales bacterium]|jgi:hypothetical protein
MRRSSTTAALAAALSCFLPLTSLAGQARSVEREISDAVSPLPTGLQAGAAVRAYRDGALAEIRGGTNGMICLADNPARKGFHTACYYQSLEPFMARGREMRGTGMSAESADSVRLAELASGALAVPAPGASLYSISHDDDAFDPSGDAATGMRRLYVVYLPYATEAGTGISATPARDRPWLMYPGKPTAHLMISR